MRGNRGGSLAWAHTGSGLRWSVKVNRSSPTSIGPERAYIFFNNDHAMLENARAMLRLFGREVPG
jgi:uncharacterized protein YecE (DUF72 family)